MSTTTAGVIFILSLTAALAVAYRYLGDYMYRVVDGTRHSRVERGLYRAIGVDSSAEQTWGVYARSVLAFSAVSLLFLYGFIRLQDKLVSILVRNPGKLVSQRQLLQDVWGPCFSGMLECCRIKLIHQGRCGYLLRRRPRRAGLHSSRRRVEPTKLNCALVVLTGRVHRFLPVRGGG